MRRLIFAAFLMLMTMAPLHAQWEFGAGIEYSDSPRMGWATYVSRMFDGKIGWTGEASGTLDDSTDMSAIGSSSSFEQFKSHPKWEGWKRYQSSSSSSFEASSNQTRRRSYTLTTGPSIRLFTRGSTDLVCRGTVGTIYREASPSNKLWRLASRSGCGLAYNFDSETGVRVTADYLYASPGLHIPVIGARFFVKF